MSCGWPHNPCKTIQHVRSPLTAATEYVSLDGTHDAENVQTAFSQTILIKNEEEKTVTKKVEKRLYSQFKVEKLYSTLSPLTKGTTQPHSHSSYLISSLLYLNTSPHFESTDELQE